MMVPILVPELGAAPSDEIRLSCWLVDRNEEVVEGDRVVELFIGDVTFDVASPASGQLLRKSVGIDESVHAGTVLGSIRVSDMDA